MNLSRKTIIILLVILTISLMIVMAIQVRPEFFNITNETFGATGNKVISMLSSVLIIIISLFTILLYRKRLTTK